MAAWRLASHELLLGYNWTTSGVFTQPLIHPLCYRYFFFVPSYMHQKSPIIMPSCLNNAKYNHTWENISPITWYPVCVFPNKGVIYTIKDTNKKSYDWSFSNPGIDYRNYFISCFCLTPFSFSPFPLLSLSPHLSFFLFPP